MLNRANVRCAAVIALLAASSAWAGTNGIVINFLETPDDTGIGLTGIDFSGNPFVGPTVSGSTYHVGVPFTANNNPTPDFRLNHIGASQTLLQNGGYLLVNILEGDGSGALSDQIYVYRDSGGNTHIDFYSIPNNFITLNPTSIVTETGALQFGLEYTSDDGTLVTVNFLSTEVPAPGAAALLGIGGLVATRRRRA